MDIKTSKDKYNLITQSIVNFEDIIQSIELIINSNIEYEFRTTLYPKYVDTADCIEIAKLLKQYNIKEYVLQQFDISNLKKCNVKPYILKQIEKIIAECNKIINTKLK
jgi:pyruvate formate lyase activating enzyme